MSLGEFIAALLAGSLLAAFVARRIRARRSVKRRAEALRFQARLEVPRGEPEVIREIRREAEAADLERLNQEWMRDGRIMLMRKKSPRATFHP